MVIRVVEFSSGGYKIGNILPKNQHTQRKIWKLLIFENWCNGEMSKFGHHFTKQSDLKLMLTKNVNNK